MRGFCKLSSLTLNHKTQYYFCATLVLIKLYTLRKKKTRKKTCFCRGHHGILLFRLLSVGSAPQACFAEAALSPARSCLLFSVMKINETVQSSAEATGALLTEEAFRLRQPFPARYHGTSERGEREKGGGGLRENIAARCCSRMSMGKARDGSFPMRNANDSNGGFICIGKNKYWGDVNVRIRFS